MMVGTIEAMRDIVFWNDITNILVGIPYALIGRSRFGYNGALVPRWIGFLTRLTFPFLVLGTALLTSGLAGIRESKAKENK